MKLYGRRESAVQKAGYSLPEYLDHSDTPEVSAFPLWNQDDFLLRALLGHHPITEL